MFPPWRPGALHVLGWSPASLNPLGILSNQGYLYLFQMEIFGGISPQDNNNFEIA